MGDTKIGATSAVGIFPSGRAECGADDMAGNVWEWCGTEWQEEYRNSEDDEDLAGTNRRVLRGGSFYDFPRNGRCANRGRLYPDNRLRSFGFRVVVVAPGFSGL